DIHSRFPLLDRLTCALAAFYTDAHASPLGLLSLQLILNVFVSTIFLAHVEGSRRGAAWTLLACTPLAGFVCTTVGGIGVYMPLMLVPLLIHHKATVESSPRANAVPLPRVFLGRAVAGQVLYGHLAWFLYTPLTVVFEKAILALVPTEQQQDLRARQVLLRVFYLLARLNTGVHVASVLAFWHSGTSTRQVAQVFGYQFRAEHAEAASAYYLLWDMVGAAWGSLLWIVADSVSPVAAMMVYAARREDQFLERFSARRYDGKAKLQ
ncbi:hypothetical protein BGZ74_003236, partial [Mortierella antarctica]